MNGYFTFIFAYAGPWITAAIVFLIWALTSYMVRHRFPAYYEWCIRVYDNLPKIAGFLIIATFIYLMFTSTSYYESP